MIYTFTEYLLCVRSEEIVNKMHVAIEQKFS